MGEWETVIVILVAVLLFGSTKIPAILKWFGRDRDGGGPPASAAGAVRK